MNKIFMYKYTPYAVLVLAALLLLTPLFRPGFILTDDGNWMIIRLSAFYQSFREGQFPVRFLGRLNYEFGYPVANFLYPGFMYVGSLIHILGFSFVDTIKILIIGSVIGSTVFLYKWLRTYFDNQAALLGALGFVWNPYLIFDIYRRGSVGEIFSFFFIAMLLFSIARRKTVLFSVAFFFLILSHNSLAFLYTIFIILYLIVIKKLKMFIVPIILGVGMATFFWFPALYERRFIVFDQTKISMPSDYFITPSTIWLLGLPGILALILSLTVKVKSVEKNLFLILYVMCVALALPLSAGVWNIKLMESLIQFPFRFLALGQIVGAWFIAFISQHHQKKRIGIIGIFISGFVLQLFTGFNLVTYQSHPEPYYTTNQATTTVKDEYLPYWVSQKPTQRSGQRVEFFQGSGTIQYRIQNLQSVDVDILATDDSILQINTIYYPGWGVTIDNEWIAPDYQNSFGVMRVPVPKGPHRLTAAFRETVPRFLADIMSLCSFILLVVYMILQRNRLIKKYI